MSDYMWIYIGVPGGNALGKDTLWNPIWAWTSSKNVEKRLKTI